jgi:serine beta-lactamase-like protein LACTB
MLASSTSATANINRAGPPVAAMNAYLKTVFQHDRPGASVLIVQNGKTLLNRAYGLANVELNVPMRTDTVFGIASVSKQFTAAAILKLAESGKVDVKAPVTRYLPQAPTTWQTITVENLLTNTSGLGNLYDDAAFRARVREDFTPEQLLTVAASKPLLASPGTQFHYASINYSLLGMVVERQSGKPFEAYLQENFFGPLGMRHTTGLSHTGVVAGLATGYGEGPSAVPYFSPSLGFAAGAHRSNTADLARWNKALYAGKVISNASLRAMTTAYHLTDGTDTHYGYGTRPHTMDGQDYIQSNGDIPGYHAETVYLPKADLYVAVLHNGEDASLDPVAKRLVQFALGQTPKLLKPVKLNGEQTQAVLGRYALDGRQRIIRLENGRVFSETPGSPPSALSALSTQEFFFDEDPDARLRFDIENGRATAVSRFNVDRAPMAKFPRVE